MIPGVTLEFPCDSGDGGLEPPTSDRSDDRRPPSVVGEGPHRVIDP